MVNGRDAIAALGVITGKQSGKGVQGGQGYSKAGVYMSKKNTVTTSALKGIRYSHQQLTLNHSQCGVFNAEMMLIYWYLYPSGRASFVLMLLFDHGTSGRGVYD